MVKVPSQTVLGQWLELYRAQLQHPVVVDWILEQRIDPNTLKVTPATGVMSATVDGVKKQFSLTDGSGWGQVSGPLLAIAKVIVPSATENLKAQWSGDSFSVSSNVVAGFYGETLPSNVSQARTQIRRLEHDHTFAAIAPDDHLRSAQALEIQRSNAARANSAAPQKLAFTRLASAVGNAYPNVREQAKQWAGDLIKQLTGKEVDPDTLYLNRFHSGQSGPDVNTVTGYEHMNEEPLSSQRLPEALLSNFSEHDRDPGTLDSISGIYTVGTGQKDNGGYGVHNEFKLAPSALMHASWKTDFQAEMTQKIDKFWSTRGDDYRTTLKGEFAHQARQQLKVFDAKTSLEQRLMPAEQQFSRADYELVMKAASNLPVDENTPVSVAQLQAEAPAKDLVRAYPLDINGWNSSDIIRFSALDDHQYNYENNRRDGTQILYIPGAKPAFVRFDSLKKMDEWILDQAKDPKKREALASHFSLYNRQDGGLLGKSGVDSSLAHLADGTWKEFEGHTIDRNYVRIKGDVFSHMKDQAKERMTSDADSAIKSDSEVTRDTWLNDITVAAGIFGKLAPLAWPVGIAAAGTGLTELALGAEKSVSGDTQAERSDGAWKAFDGTLNTLFSANASGKVEDPFAAPRENVTTLPTQRSTDSRAEEPFTQQALQVKSAQQAASFPNMRDIEFQGKTYFVADQPDAGDGVNYLLRIRDPKVPSKLASSGIIANPDEAGVWSRRGEVGGWPWQRPKSPTPSIEPKIPLLSDQFLEIDGAKMKGATTLDKYLNTAEHEYTYGIAVNDQGEQIPQVSWTVEENPANATPHPRAEKSTFGTSEYSEQFIKDINRSRFTVNTPEGVVLEIDIPKEVQLLELKKGAKLSTAELDSVIQENIQKLESAIPGPALRARISEVANQWLLGAATDEFRTTRFKGTVFGSGRDPHYIIDYNPADVTTIVTAKSDFILNKLDERNGEIETLTDVNVKASRSISINRHPNITLNNEPYTISGSAPTRIEITPKQG